MSIAIIDGLDTRGTAIYWPDLQAYRQSDFESSLRYFNQYGRQDYIDVQHSVEFGRYMGEKYIHGKNVATTYGTTWKSFFIHLTMTGLTEGEQCEFSPIDKISKVW